MMSLSDRKNPEKDGPDKNSIDGDNFDQKNTESDEWQPLDITSLEQCSDKAELKKKHLATDDNVFKRLYEESRSSDDMVFERIYNDDSLDAQDQGSLDFKIFKPLQFNKVGGIHQQDQKKIISVQDQNVSHDPGSGLENPGEEDGGNAFHEGNKDDRVSHPELSQTELPDRPDEVMENDDIQEREHNLQEIRKKGYGEGFAEGLEQGLAKGHEKGEKTGYDAGFEKGEQAGYYAGFEKGETDGRLVADAKAAEIIASLEQICLNLETAWQDSVKNNEAQILSLICKIAEKVVFARVEIEESVVKDSVLHAMEAMPESRDVTLTIAPEDYEYIEMIKDTFFDKMQNLERVSVLSSSSVKRGGCRIESSKGRVETDIQSRLDAVFSSIVDAGMQ